MTEAVLYVDKDTDVMRATFVAVGLARLCSEVFGPGSGVDTRIRDMGSAFVLVVQREGKPVHLDELLEAAAARGHLPPLLPAIFKPLTAKEKKRVEAGEEIEEVLRKYIPAGFPLHPVDYGAARELPEPPDDDTARQEGATYRPVDYPLWAHLCSYFGKGSAMRTGYPLVVHAWHAHQGEHAVALLRLIFETYGTYPNLVEEAAEVWVDEIKAAVAYADFELFGWKQSDYTVSALSIVSPTTAQGSFTVNAVRNPNTGTPDIFWLELYLAFVGFMATAMPYRAGGDVLTYYPLPTDIGFKALQQFVTEYRDKSYTRRLYRYSNQMPRAKIDALALVNFYRAMVQHLQNQKDAFWGMEAVRGLVGYYYKDISTQIPFDETTFDLPGWLHVEPTDEQLEEADALLEQHYNLVNALRGSYGEELAILAAYRQFLARGKSEDWIEFAIAYSTHRFLKLEDSPWLPQLHLSLLRRTLMNSNDHKDYTPIFEVPGFVNIAKAIRACTVNLRYWKDVKNSPTAFRVRHGLGDDLRRHAHDPDRFIEALSSFVADYQRESSGVQAATGETRPFITDTDLMEVVALVSDPRYGSRVVANLLVAAGYSSDYDRSRQAADQTVDS